MNKKSIRSQRNSVLEPPWSRLGGVQAVMEVERMCYVFFDVTTSSSLFRWETVPSVGLWNGCVLSFSIRRVLCSDGKRLSLLGCGTVQFCLFLCNNVEFISRHSSFINQSRLIFESILKDKQVP